jgi:ABC-2 type transport system ATP-binding protein
VDLGPTRPDAAAQELLAGALRLGVVQEFSPVRPTLADLFRGVVSSEPAPAGPGPEQAGGRRGRGRREVAA